MLLFAADIHLRALDATAASFFAWLECASDASAVYLLGDIFDLWLGDDDDNPVAPELGRRLQALADAGVATYWQHGNRDFLVSASWLQGYGCELLPEEALLEHNGERVLLMHGDSLCTDDVDYQQLRQSLRSPAWQSRFLSFSLAERRSQARQLAQQSAAAKGGKREQIMDVNSTSVQAACRRHRADMLIHGHTHRPAIDSVNLDGRQLPRWVLGAWSASGGVSYRL